MASESSDLDDGSDDHDKASPHDHVSSTEALSEEVGKDGTEEATDFVDLSGERTVQLLIRGC